MIKKMIMIHIIVHFSKMNDMIIQLYNLLKFNDLLNQSNRFISFKRIISVEMKVGLVDLMKKKDQQMKDPWELLKKLREPMNLHQIQTISNI